MCRFAMIKKKRGFYMKNQYNKTITACFVGYVVQAIVNNFVPLLFFDISEKFWDYSITDYITCYV